MFLTDTSVLHTLEVRVLGFSGEVSVYINGDSWSTEQLLGCLWDMRPDALTCGVMFWRCTEPFFFLLSASLTTKYCLGLKDMLGKGRAEKSREE
jgi:hypothetical protein